MAAFKRTEIFQPPRVKARTTEDTLYWKNYEFPVSIKEYGPIDFTDFSPQSPFNFAVTSSSKIQIFSSETNEVIKVISRFKKAAFGGKFRSDGKLLTSGSEEGVVSLFDVQSKSQLRLFKGHTGPVHRCNFSQSGTHIASFSDDQSVGVWDIPSETRIATLEGHKDYIRTGLISPNNQSLIISGSYDHTVKLFDLRSSECTHTFNHGSPVESVVAFPAGSVAISAGGTNLKVWDIVSGRLLAQLTQHHKTVTCLCFGRNYSRLLSGSLDRQVKIFDTQCYQVVHTLDFPAPLLNIALSPEDKVVVGGMADGLISIRHQKEPENKEAKAEKKTHYRYRVFHDAFRPVEGDVTVKEQKAEKLSHVDRQLKSFQSSKAFDLVLRDYIFKKKPYIAISTMKELIRRGALKSAMAGRDAASLTPIMKFVTRHISDPQYSRILVDVAAMLIDIYGTKLGDSTELKEHFINLQRAVELELKLIKEIFEVCGILQTVLSVSSQHTLTDLGHSDDPLPVPETRSS